jgi:hypothetical protein
MNLVRQDGFPQACQQACIAMIADVALTDVVAMVGTEPLSFADRTRALTHFGFAEDRSRYIVQGYGRDCLGALIRRHKVMLCRLADCLNVQFSHCVLISDGRMLDPDYGENPVWPWSRYVVDAGPVNRIGIADA